MEGLFALRVHSFGIHKIFSKCLKIHDYRDFSLDIKNNVGKKKSQEKKAAGYSYTPRIFSNDPDL